MSWLHLCSEHNKTHPDLWTNPSFVVAELNSPLINNNNNDNDEDDDDDTRPATPTQELSTLSTGPSALVCLFRPDQ